MNGNIHVSNSVDLRYYLIIGKPSPALKSAIPTLATKGLFKCLGIVENGKIPWKELFVSPPDFIIFNLDIGAQELNNLVQKLKPHLEPTTTYIGITDSADMGFRAFKLGFKDVLPTSLNRDELINAFLRNLNFRKGASDPICFNSFRDTFYLRPGEILYLKADNFTTDVYLTNGGTIGVLRTLKTFTFLLPPQFVRIQRSIIINTGYLYHVNDAKKRCGLIGVATDFKYSEKFIPHKLLLQRWL